MKPSSLHCQKWSWPLPRHFILQCAIILADLRSIFPTDGAVAKYQKGSCLLTAQYYKAAWLPHGHPQFACCSTDLQSVLKAVALLSSFRLGIGLELQKEKKKKLPILGSTGPLKRPPFGFQQTPQKSANFQDHFKPLEPTELRWKLYTNSLIYRTSETLLRIFSKVLIRQLVGQMSSLVFWIWYFHSSRFSCQEIQVSTWLTSIESLRLEWPIISPSPSITPCFWLPWPLSATSALFFTPPAMAVPPPPVSIGSFHVGFLNLRKTFKVILSELVSMHYFSVQKPWIYNTL